MITVDASDPLMSNTQKQEDNIFDMSMKVKKLLFQSSASLSSRSESAAASPTATSESRSVKLPKIEVPTFDGELLHWQTFWDQLSISIDKRSDISNTEKLVYLRQSLKDGSAKNVTEGLSLSRLGMTTCGSFTKHKSGKSTKCQALQLVQARS